MEQGKFFWKYFKRIFNEFFVRMGGGEGKGGEKKEKDWMS